MALELTSENFQAEVLNSDLPVLIDFWAPWCGPCRMMSPIIDELSAEYNGKVKIAKINVDNERDLAMQYGVSSIPSLKLFKNGAVVREAIGAMPIDKVRALIDG